DEIIYGKRAHAHSEVDQRAVDFLHRGALLNQESGFSQVRPKDAVANEAGPVSGQNGNFAEALAERHTSGSDVRLRSLSRYYLDKAHDICRTEKVKSNSVIRPTAALSNRVHVQAGGVCRQYAVRADVPAQIRHHRLFD